MGIDLAQAYPRLSQAVEAGIGARIGKGNAP